MTKSIYKKDNSFSGLSGIDNNTEELLARIRRLQCQLDTINMPPHQLNVIRSACEDLLSGVENTQKVFWLRPHIIAEIRLLSDENLPRYLYYRYRYDQNPTNFVTDKFPPCVQIEPTSVCNYRCVFCYQTDPRLQDRKAGHKGRMSVDTFKQVIDQIEGEVEAVTLASRGEPLVAKGIEEMLAYAAGKFLGLKINTNAWYLDEKKAHAILQAEPNTLVFSADAADAELYAKLRVNGKLERVLENVRKFSEIREKHYPKSSIITRVSGVKTSDQQDFSSIEGFWKEYVDQVAFVDYNPSHGGGFYDGEQSGVNAPCSELWRRTFVWWDGRVNPCEVDYLSSLSMGNIHDTSLTEIWQGDEYEALRTEHLKGARSESKICKSCFVV